MTKTVFISYSWDDEEHKEWVRSLADDLVKHGVDVLLDQYDLSVGHELTFFMEKAMTADKVLLIITPSYRLKADKRTGGVGYEYSLFTKELYDKAPDTSRIIPVLRKGSHKDSLPTFMQTRICYDMTDGKDYDSKPFGLMRIILDKPAIKKPPLGKLPNFEECSMPEIDKAVSDFKVREAQLIKMKETIESVKGVQYFNSVALSIVKKVEDGINAYRKSFNFYVKSGSQPNYIIASAGNFNSFSSRKSNFEFGF